MLVSVCHHLLRAQNVSLSSFLPCSALKCALNCIVKVIGFSFCRDHLREAEVMANADQQSAEQRFRTWATKYVPDAKLMNVGSGPQIRQLFFSGAVNNNPLKKDEYVEKERIFKVKLFTNPLLLPFII